MAIDIIVAMCVVGLVADVILVIHYFLCERRKRGDFEFKQVCTNSMQGLENTFLRQRITNLETKLGRK